MTDSEDSGVVAVSTILERLREILNTHPQIFNDHPDLLELIDIPDRQDDGVASLLEKQARVLREKISGLNTSSTRMIEAARENELISDRLFHVICDLLAADDIESLLDALYTNLKEKFNVDWVTLRISAHCNTPGIAEISPEHGNSPAYTEALSMVTRHSHCDERLPALLLEYLFAERGELVRSVAIVPVHATPQGTEVLGLLALGSRSQQQFQPGLGTLHLDRLGRIFGVLLNKYVTPAEQAGAR